MGRFQGFEYIFRQSYLAEKDDLTINEEPLTKAAGVNVLKPMHSLVLYIVSVFNEKESFLPTMQAKHFLKIFDTPVFKNKLQRQNHFITQLCSVSTINQIVLDVLCSFFVRN